ncbi:hypothetical protein KW797_04825, partial [Candidatus Parcubacteria bacterium]|nr:hypothetical protein [Candidatus Parcubacteria bacterium]
MRPIAKVIFFAAIVPFFMFGGDVEPAEAQTLKKSIEVSGWIPYWRKATGTQEALLHLDAFTELNPFGYTVRSNGTLADTAKLDEEPWTTLIAEERKKKIRP